MERKIISDDEVREMMIAVETKTVTRAICPHCDKPDSTIDHLLGTERETKWYCDECGGRYELHFSKTRCAFYRLNEWRIDLAVVLKYQEAIVVVKGMAFAEGDKSAYDTSHIEYHYNEGTCPTNWMGVECLYDNAIGDPDPHGMFKFIGFELYPEGGEECDFDWGPLIIRVREEWYRNGI